MKTYAEPLPIQVFSLEGQWPFCLRLRVHVALCCLFNITTPALFEQIPFVFQMCNVALRHETGSAVKTGSVNSEVDQSPRPYVVDVVDSNYPAQLTTTTTNVNSS